jgi:phenylpropionate dioxygenase-like ring-hydroxylating dioxygenase large terminal subunit
MASVAEREVTRESVRISGENYLSSEFAAGEKAHLWPKVWQVACREEEIPKRGDYIVYDVADDTIVVVRGKNDEIRAFFNVCPHRGRQIMEGSGHAVNFRCGYHNWTFDLDGKNVIVQDKHDWAGALDKECLDLVKVKTGTWGGFVWINMDPDSESLEDYLSPIQEYLDPFEFEHMRYRWALELHIDCNWKVALEAFMEGYHVAATHTQLLDEQGEDYTTSFAHGKHSHFGYWDSQVPIGLPSPRLKKEHPKDVRPGVIEFFRNIRRDLHRPRLRGRKAHPRRSAGRRRPDDGVRHGDRVRSPGGREGGLRLSAQPDARSDVPRRDRLERVPELRDLALFRWRRVVSRPAAGRRSE